MRKLVLLAMVAMALPACAQVFDMEHNRVQMAPLDGLMRFHTGDNPQWSQPGFDDSAWPLLSSEHDWSEQGYKNYGGFAWYRFSVILPSDRHPLGLYIPPVRTSYQVFADGRLVGTFGGFPPHGAVDTSQPHLVLLPETPAANAGHLSPWIEGKEFSLENGLPLGLAATSTYAESSFRLNAEAQITLMTDGVVEARSAGGELFGFEKTREISEQTAEQIAHAAQRFGQEDDITVLTVSFAGTEVLHA